MNPIYYSPKAGIACTMEQGRFFMRTIDSRYNTTGPWIEYPEMTLERAFAGWSSAKDEAGQMRWGCIHSCLTENIESRWYREPGSEKLQRLVDKHMATLRKALQREAADRPIIMTAADGENP